MISLKLIHKVKTKIYTYSIPGAKKHKKKIVVKTFADFLILKGNRRFFKVTELRKLLRNATKIDRCFTIESKNINSFK